MQIFKRKAILGAAVGMGVMLILAVIFLCVGDHGEFAPKLVFSVIFFILLSSIGFLAAALHESLRITLYAYKNIGLIGGIIFDSIMAISILSNYFSCQKAGEFSLARMYQAMLKFPRDFSFYGVFVLLAVSIALGVSNISLIRHEGLSRNNVLSIVLAGFYCCATVAVFFASDAISKYVLLRRADASPALRAVDASLSMFLMLLLCYLECTFWGTVIMGWAVQKKRAAYDKDYIIILGCSIDKKGGLLPLLKGRVNAAIRFAWDQEIATGKPAKYVPSGGQGANEIMSEGSAMELYLMTRGAEAYEIFPEKKSVNTLENMKFSKAIIDEIDPDATIAFATTNYHILRSGILAREAGFDAEGIPGDTKWYFWPNGFVREFFGIIALKKKAHIFVAAGLAVISVLIGLVGYFGRFI